LTTSYEICTNPTSGASRATGRRGLPGRSPTPSRLAAKSNMIRQNIATARPGSADRIPPRSRVSTPLRRPPRSVAENAGLGRRIVTTIRVPGGRRPSAYQLRGVGPSWWPAGAYNSTSTTRSLERTMRDGLGKTVTSRPTPAVRRGRPCGSSSRSQEVAFGASTCSGWLPAPLGPSPAGAGGPSAYGAVRSRSGMSRSTARRDPGRARPRPPSRPFSLRVGQHAGPRAGTSRQAQDPLRYRAGPRRARSRPTTPRTSPCGSLLRP